MSKKFFLGLTFILVLLVLSIPLTACSSVIDSVQDALTTENEETTKKPETETGLVDTSDSVIVVFEVKDYGKITVALYPNEAPITVRNFVKYVEDGFYDGLIFHRVIENFMIQGGDPTGTGYGDPSLETIKGEFSTNGVDNDLKFERGVIGMARSNEPNSASSQFFIMHQTTESLDGLYAAFGKVIGGMNVVDAIATCEKTDTIDASGNHYIPADKVIIERVYIVK